MKSVILILALFVMPLQGQKPPVTPPQDPGRYQLLAVSLDDTYPASIGSSSNHRGPSQQLFLFDSETGRVWHYRPESFAGNGPGTTFAPEAFIPVSIWSPGPKDRVLPDGN
jgi:hypothetical protein